MKLEGVGEGVGEMASVTDRGGSPLVPNELAAKEGVCCTVGPSMNNAPADMLADCEIVMLFDADGEGEPLSEGVPLEDREGEGEGEAREDGVAELLGDWDAAGVELAEGEGEGRGE